jgi:hypothetical protein
MHLTILLLVFSMLFLVYGVVKSAQERDREAPTDPNWYDIKHFTEAAEIIDDEDMRTLLDESLNAGSLDSGMTMRAWHEAPALSLPPRWSICSMCSTCSKTTSQPRQTTLRKKPQRTVPQEPPTRPLFRPPLPASMLPISPTVPTSTT